MAWLYSLLCPCFAWRIQSETKEDDWRGDAIGGPSAVVRRRVTAVGNCRVGTLCASSPARYSRAKLAQGRRGCRMTSAAAKPLDGCPSETEPYAEFEDRLLREHHYTAQAARVRLVTIQALLLAREGKRKRCALLSSTRSKPRICPTCRTADEMRSPPSPGHPRGPQAERPSRHGRAVASAKSATARVIATSEGARGRYTSRPIQTCTYPDLVTTFTEQIGEKMRTVRYRSSTKFHLWLSFAHKYLRDEMPVDGASHISRQN